MKRYPAKFHALINFEDNVKPSKKLATLAFQNAVTDMNYRLSGYKMQEGEEIGWFTSGMFYELHYTDDGKHNLYVTIIGDNVPTIKNYDYPEVKNIAAIMKARTKPVKVSKFTKPRNIAVLEVSS